MDQFDAFFRRADLDHDGRISGAEAVAFFQGSNLPKPVLAQIWQHADQNRIGFLGRQEFYNALKLVTVAQSKRELTPDIVKAALYGPASAKIPAPQINLAALSPAQPNPMGPRPPAQQPAVVSSMGPRLPAQQPAVASSMGPRMPAQQPTFVSSMGPRPPAQQPAVVNLMGPRPPAQQPQNFGIRSQGIPNTMTPPSAQFLAPQGNQSMRPPGGSLVSNPMFGGDMFSASQNPSKPLPSAQMPAQHASNPPVSSVIAPLTSTVKIDPIGALNAFARQPTAGPVQSASPSPSVPRPSQTGPPQNGAFGQNWPKMTAAGVNKYMKVFMEVDSDRDGKITGEQARSLFLSWRLPREILKQVWDLSDQDNDSMLSLREFCIALYLMERHREGQNLPPTLPTNVLLDQTLLSLTGPPAPGSVPMAHGGLRPPVAMQQYNQQKSAVPPSMVPSHGTHLTNGNQIQNVPPHSVSRETTEPEKVVEEKVIMDSREKMAFYRNKMQDLVLYKSRCDNRLNEITERAIADKREAEMVAKKYEDKYKQVAEVASKLTIEEASFRDIQERKMELNQALVKMEQGGSADGILQVRADRIQSDLEELLKALAQRCQKHGIDVKSTALIKLPEGWQPGVPEISAVWDEDWDKFEDQGFQFDVANGKSKSTTSEAENENENAMDNNNYSQDSHSNADTKSEKLFDTESTYPHSETEDDTTQKIFQSPTKEDSFGKGFNAESPTERSFDDQGWGTFDNNDDVDSVWGFNNDTTKDNDHEKHGENYFFDSNSFTTSPRGTDSPQANNFFQKKSPFGFDDSVPGSPASRPATSPRYSGAENSFFDNFSTYDSGSPKRDTFSRFDSMSSATQDHNFSRFDSMSSSTQDRSFARFDSMSSSVGGFDHGQPYSFDDSDPFGSSGPFKVSSSETSQSQTGKNESDKWAF